MSRPADDSGNGKNCGCNRFNIFVQGEISVESSLLANEFLDVFLEDKFARVGECVNRVPHAVNQTRAVERLLVDDFFKCKRQLRRGRTNR